MDAGDEILKRIDERQDEWLRLLGDLVRRPSENPPGDPRAAADCLVEYLKRQGHAHEVVEPQPGMVNVVAATDRGPGRSIILNGHLDTFPVGDRSGWERDPFSGEVADGKGFGRGVSGMKAGAAGSPLALCPLFQVGEAGEVRLPLPGVP